VSKLWSKGYELDPIIEQYTAARNAALDAELVRYDLWGSLAQARMLRRIGVLTSQECAALVGALRQLLTEAEAGSLKPETAEEDMHTAIEHRLVQMVGEAGKKIHTGRSRNDQVLLDLRLYAKAALLEIAESLLTTAACLLMLAQDHEWVPMPGYTHMQRGMLSSVGLWASSYAEALLDDCGSLASAYALNDQSPLGSGAAYGAPLPLDRAYVAELLGFGQVHHNVLTAANARGKGEAAVVQALALVMLDLSKWAQDVLLFTTREYNFFQVPQELCDGSSMMPQKRNLSALELVRARAHTVIALQGQMLSTLAGLPSGYNMDYQETKAPLIEAVHLCRESLEVVFLFARGLKANEQQLRAACTAELFATDHALELARSGTAFRDAYVQVAANPEALQASDLMQRLKARAHEGAPGNLDLAGLAGRITSEQAIWQQRVTRFEAALAKLVEESDL
jgi:argininosuccinate lyase